MRALLLLLIFVPAAAGQGLFITDDNEAAPATGDTIYALTKAVPSADASFKAYTATGLGALTYTTAFHYTSTGITAEAPWTWTVYISCDVPTAFRVGVPNQQNDIPTMRVQLHNGLEDGDEVARAMLYEERTCDGPDDIWEAVFELDATGHTFAPGTLVRVENILWSASGGAGTDAHNVHFLGGSLAHPSGLVGAGLGDAVEPSGPVVVQENFTDSFRHTFSTPQNSTYLMHFDGLAEMAWSVNATTDAGSASAALYDGEGIMVREWSSSEADLNETVVGAPGRWSLNVTYEGFVGELGMSFAAPADETPEDEDDPSDDDTKGGVEDGNTTADDDGEDTAGPPTQESPMLPAVVIIAALALLARRR